MSTDHPQLGASPDRVINDEEIVEVKCPYTAREHPVNPNTTPFLEKVGQSLQLKCNHDYYYQIQGQLFCSKRKLCNLVIYTFKEVVCVKVHRDEPFIQSMVEKLMQFYENFFKKAILDEFFYKNYYKFNFDD